MQNWYEEELKTHQGKTIIFDNYQGNYIEPK
jgi:hypothetical protein